MGDQKKVCCVVIILGLSQQNMYLPDCSECILWRQKHNSLSKDLITCLKLVCLMCYIIIVPYRQDSRMLHPKWSTSEMYHQMLLIQRCVRTHTISCFCVCHFIFQVVRVVQSISSTVRCSVYLLPKRKRCVLPFLDVFCCCCLCFAALLKGDVGLWPYCNWGEYSVNLWVRVWPNILEWGWWPSILKWGCVTVS